MFPADAPYKTRCGHRRRNLAQARRIADDLAIFWVVDGVGRLIEAGPAAQVFAKPAREISAMYIAGARGLQIEIMRIPRVSAGTSLMAA